MTEVSSTGAVVDSTETVVSTLNGDVGIESVGALHGQLLEHCDSNAQITIDCGDVSSMDVASMQLLLSAMLQPGSRIRIDSGEGGSPAADAINLAGLSALFAAVETAVRPTNADPADLQS